MTIIAEIARLRLQTNLQLARELVSKHPGLTLQHALQIVERERKGE